MLIITLLSMFVYSAAAEPEYYAELQAHIDDWLKPVAKTRLYGQRKKEAIAMIPTILKYCEMYNVDPLRIAILISEENSWKQIGNGKKGEIGPLQVMPRLFRQFGLHTLDGQLHAGIYWFSEGMRRCNGNGAQANQWYFASGKCRLVPSNRARRRDRLYRRAVLKYRKKKEH